MTKELRYIFGDIDDPNSLDIRRDEFSGFIELVYEEGEISIELVRRPTCWDKPFCVPILPAAIKDFIINVLHKQVDQIDRITVFNMADKVLTACKCYIGLMTEMGH